MSTSGDDTCEECNYYLELSKSRLTFEGASKSKLTNVFYDECNTQVFSVRSGDVTEVNVKSPYEEFCKTFKMEEKGHVISIKFSPDMKILSVQRTRQAIDFLTFENDTIGFEFPYSYKGTNASLLGYMWVGNTEIVLISDQGVKLCKVNPASKCVAQIKNYNVNVQWYTFFHPLGLLLLNYGATAAGTSLQLLQIKVNQIVRLSKFELGEDILSKSTRPAPTDRDVIIGLIYSKPRILIMNYQNVSTGCRAVVIIYTIVKLATVKKTHVLRIKDPGRFALSLVDNLVIVHNQVNKQSLVFDIGDDDPKGAVSFHNPIAEPKSIAPDCCESYELYSPNWIIFQPNIVLDAKLGCLWIIGLNLNGFIKSIPDPVQLVSFLLMRSNPKEVLAFTLEQIVSNKEKNLEVLSNIFDQINQIYRKHLEENLKGQVSLSPNMYKIDDDPNLSFKTVLDQTFIYTFVFSKLADKLTSDSPRRDIKSFNWTLVEYIRSLVFYQIPVQHLFYELLINMLVMNKEFFQLHQLLQYHAIYDSKPLACRLLFLESVYPAALQLALDMLQRIGSSKEEIIEILISKKQILSAIRYAKSNSGPNERLPVAKYIEAAKQVNDPDLQQAVLNHFNIKTPVDA